MKPSLNIAFLIKGFLKTGGKERYAVELARRLVRRGHTVELYARKADPALLDGIPMHKVPQKFAFSHVANSISFSSETARMLKDRRHDIIHSHERTCHQDVRTIHTFSFKSGTRHFSLFKKFYRICLSPRSLMYFWLEKREMQTPWLIPTGRVLETDIAENYGRTKNVRTITPGADIDSFHPEWIAANRDRVRAEENISENDIVVTFVGSEFKRKGLDHLFPAVGPGMHLLAVGRGQRMHHYRRLVEKCGLSGRVHFKGLADDVRRYYAAADIVALPSLSEAFGMAVLEGMACGLCVVTTPNSGAAALIEDGRNGFIARSPAQLRELLARLASDDRLRRTAGQAARATAEKHTWDHVSDQYENLYCEILKERRQTP